jgi:cytochrome c oxidase cbb3-type subunit III
MRWRSLGDYNLLRKQPKSTIAIRSLIMSGTLLASLFLFVSTARGGEHAAPRGPGQTPDVKQGHDEGRQAFESRCAGCHGLDGRGGERAPDVATRASVQRRSDAELFQIIQSGIPARGMPSFSTMDRSQVRALVSYLRVLQGKIGGGTVSGDAQHGKALFFGKARCSECHMVDGVGGFIAADLSSYGRTRAPEEIRSAIVSKQNKNGSVDDRLSTATLRDGQKFSGVLRNEDNFSVQLQTLDGAFQLLTKAELQSLVRSSEPLMPSNYGSTLSPNEIDELISFLVASARSGKIAPASNARKKRSEKNND